MELGALNKGLRYPVDAKRVVVAYLRTGGFTVTRGCRLMSLARSSYYQPISGAAARRARDAILLNEIDRIASELPAYGYRWITHELRRRGTVVNHKRVARVMREGQVAPTRVRRLVATACCADDVPVIPSLVRDRVVTGLNQIWYSDLTYIRLRTRFVFLAVLLDAWSRKVVGMH